MEVSNYVCRECGERLYKKWVTRGKYSTVTMLTHKDGKNMHSPVPVHKKYTPC